MSYEGGGIGAQLEEAMLEKGKVLKRYQKLSNVISV